VLVTRVKCAVSGFHLRSLSPPLLNPQLSAFFRALCVPPPFHLCFSGHSPLNSLIRHSRLFKFSLLFSSRPLVHLQFFIPLIFALAVSPSFDSSVSSSDPSVREHFHNRISARKSNCLSSHIFNAKEATNKEEPIPFVD